MIEERFRASLVFPALYGGVRVFVADGALSTMPAMRGRKKRREEEVVDKSREWEEAREGEGEAKKLGKEERNERGKEPEDQSEGGGGDGIEEGEANEEKS